MDTEVENKINQIAQLLEKNYKGKNKGKSPPAYLIGMFTTLQQNELTWIDTGLKSASEHIKEIKCINPNDVKTKEFEKTISESTLCMYICSEQKWKNLTPSDRKIFLSRFGKKTPVVLIIDMADSSDEEKDRIIKDYPAIKKYALDLFLFRRIEEKSDIPQDPGFDRGASNSFRGGSYENNMSSAYSNQYRNLPYRLPQPAPIPDGRGLQSEMSQRLIDRKHIVGIFSRSGDQDYAWLARFCKETFQDFVGDVKYCYISNYGDEQLRDGMSQCTFGILYHTKKRGRVNITDVKESLYDEELEILSTELGRRNIIVLVDDLEDSSDEEKARILQSQPRINKLACELILISDSDKANDLKLTTKLKTLKLIFGGQYSGRQIQSTAKPEPYRNPPNPHLELQYPTNGADEYSGQGMQNTRNPDQYGHPLYHPLERRNTASGPGEYSGQRMQNSGNPGQYDHPPYQHLPPPYMAPGAGEYSGQKMQNTGNPEQYDHPSYHRNPPPYMAHDAGNVSPALSRVSNTVTTSSKSTVAIFSKSEESDYSWLSQQISSGDIEVRSYNISSLNRDHPPETIFQCKLVILYHNMHNGKLRLTDSKDALYHEELEMLSIKFGKRKLIVVIDDLVDSSDKIKSDINKNQPSTKNFVGDIFLFSMKEKKYLNKNDPGKEGRKTMAKISTIRDMMSKQPS